MIYFQNFSTNIFILDSAEEIISTEPDINEQQGSSDNVEASILSGEEISQNEESILITVLSVFSPIVILVIFLLFWMILMSPNQNGNKSISGKFNFK